MKEIMNQINENPNDGSLYIQMGDEYAKTNCNQAYLCYEHASSLCKSHQLEEIHNKMMECKSNENFCVHPASFVILSYNSKDIMIECLEAIRNTCVKGSYEVIVVDSNSTDGIREWLKEQKDITLILNDQFDGFAASCNQGAKCANLENDIFLLNNDAILTPRSFLYMRLALYSQKKIGAVGPVSANVIKEQLYDTNKRSHDEWMELAELINQASEHPIQFAHWLQGHALLIKRRVWDEVGMLDTNFKFGGAEDVEYSIRLNLSGYQLGICKNAFVYHYGSQSMNQMKNKYNHALSLNHKLFEKKYNLPISKLIDDSYFSEVQLLKEKNHLKQMNILQIYGGCCNLLNVIKYQYPNANLYAIEKNSTAARVASNYSVSKYLDLNYDDLMFDNESFDYIFFDDIESCFDLKSVLQKLNQLLKPNGHLILKGKNACHISVIESLISGSLKTKLLENTHCFYTTDDLYQLVLSCDFTIPNLVWTYQPQFMINHETEQKLLNALKTLSYSKSENTYLHTSVYIDAKKNNKKQCENKTNLKVMPKEQTLDFILQTHCSIARFGDGEFDIMAGNSIPYQSHDQNLAKELREIVGRQSDLCFISCLPDVFEDKGRYNEECLNFWNQHLENYMPLYQEVCLSKWYGSTFLSRPYIDLKDKSTSNTYFEKLKSLWDSKDVLIVEGEFSRSGVGNDLFDNAQSIQRIICPSKNAYSQIQEIESEIRRHGKDKLILLMLGPTAKVISYHLYKEGYWLIDLGHIDSEYEWYKLGATTKVKLNNKHTAEHNFDQNIELDFDEKYEKSIIAKIN